MLRLLKIEWLKNFSYRPFKIFSILYFIILGGLLFIGLVDIQFGEFTLNLKDQGIYDFPALWNFTTYIVAILKIFLGCIIIFSITQEFTNRMFKQNIIDGLSRQEFVISKVFTIVIFSFVSTLIVMIISFILGFLYSKDTSFEMVFREFYFIGNYFLKLFTFFSLLLFLSVLFRNSIFVFLSIFILWMVGSIIGGIEYAIRFHSIDGNTIKTIKDSILITNYTPLNAMSKLIPLPVERTELAKILGVKYEYNFPIDSVIACIIYSAIFIFGSYYILKKKDW